MAGKWTLVAFSESQDEAGAYAGVAAVTDQHVRVSGDTIYVPDEYQNIAQILALTGATVPGTPYLDSPSLRARALFDISPVSDLVLPTNDSNFVDRRLLPLKLKADEGILAYSNANPAAAEYHSILLWLSDGLIEPVKGDCFSVRFTAAITTVAGAWSSGEITLAQNLPSGRYAVVGASCHAAGGIAFRFIPRGYTNRPGGAMGQDIADTFHGVFRAGNFGKWFEFDHNNPPALEVLANAVVAAETGYLDLIQVG